MTRFGSAVDFILLALTLPVFIVVVGDRVIDAARQVWRIIRRAKVKKQETGRPVQVGGRLQHGFSN